MGFFDYLRGFSKEQRYRTISTHPKAPQRYAKDFNKLMQKRAINQNVFTLPQPQNFELPKPPSSFTDKFMKKFQ